ncbi:MULTISPECIES: hypothetical protein [Methylobacterium]|uniref:DUF3618 domain-containing protein n=1 Tax=Methylobacterium thuringiense TaxID=1003091 RepID=A0ABQ4TK03_9HYPH|nr:MULTISPECIES: hypothetical protein [Methylobacterium]TXN21472.1 hypothetical protein FV217_14370 [Methylobacterium sp. WL9]GJE55149.1 hypothetical protein EKPJFOCH_1637 [Methylobacterium thuringiense]
MTASPTPGQASDPGDLHDLKRDVEDTVDVAVERGRGFAAAARTHAVNLAEGRKAEAAKSVSGLAHSLRDSGRTFDDRPNVKAFFDSAAEGLDDLAGSIETRSFNDFYQDAEAFARRSPVAVAVATFAAGFLLARFVKSSGERQIDGDYDRERV